MSKLGNKSGRAIRHAIREMAELTDEDLKWEMCRHTGLSYQDILAIIAQNYKDSYAWPKVLRIHRQKIYKLDDSWFATIHQWIKMFIPQWEGTFRAVTQELAVQPLTQLDEERILEVSAKALGISPDVLMHFAKNREDIERFLEMQRSTLGTVAETKLWELVMQGDAPTIRWLLPRIKSDIFGDKLPGGDGDKLPRTIKIIDVTD